MDFLEIAHFPNKPMYELKKIDDVTARVEYYKETIPVHDHTEFVEGLLDMKYEFYAKHAVEPDFLYVCTEDYRKLISAYAHRTGHTGLITDFVGMKILVVPSLPSPQVGMKDPATMLSIDYFNKKS